MTFFQQLLKYLQSSFKYPFLICSLYVLRIVLSQTIFLNINLLLLRILVIDSFFLYTILSEIIGTKDYRKPEWVSEMEEMKEALSGKVPYR